jgi:hypothetical protein
MQVANPEAVQIVKYSKAEANENEIGTAAFEVGDLATVPLPFVEACSKGTLAGVPTATRRASRRLLPGK